MSPYRTAPPAPVRAPRASWWRRFWHRGVGRRLVLRRLRHVALAEAPWSSWSSRNFLAREFLDAAHRYEVDDVLHAFTLMLRVERRRHRALTEIGALLAAGGAS